MDRITMINTIGNSYCTSNLENGEFSYYKALNEAGVGFEPILDENGRAFKDLDIRFVKDNVSVLIETKTKFKKKDEKQLSAYVEYEKRLNSNKIVAILANTGDDKIKVWKQDINDESVLSYEDVLKSIDEYVDIFSSRVNNKEKVMKNTYELNQKLHKYGITEELRSQFVGTCLLALKNNLDYKIASLTTNQINTRIEEILGTLLDGDMKKAEKLAIISSNVLRSQVVEDLKPGDYKNILKYIEDNILPFINDRSTAGQDLLNLFFVTFNKYVKSDKNQAFTPDHITDFMSKVVGVNKHSIILDPCCGSGSFLVRAMTEAFYDCTTEQEKKNIKQKQILGIEYDKNVYGLSTTNMLIHGDGNSNIRNGSCFALKNWIQENRPNVILMNPPYNAQRKHVPESFSNTWKDNAKQDPSKGFYFVKYIADTLNEINQQATLAVLLPVACAIGGKNKYITDIKEHILKNNTLDAVFTLPAEVFYPGASASVCCMVFKIGKKHSHESNPKTFFGYYKDDNFKKKKNLGRVEQTDQDGHSLWKETEKMWLELYRERKVVDGLSATKTVNASDEWLCEAYMKTDYSKLTQNDFELTIRKYLAYKVGEGDFNE